MIVGIFCYHEASKNLMNSTGKQAMLFFFFFSLPTHPVVVTHFLCALCSLQPIVYFGFSSHFCQILM